RLGGRRARWGKPGRVSAPLVAPPPPATGPGRAPGLGCARPYRSLLNSGRGPRRMRAGAAGGTGAAPPAVALLDRLEQAVVVAPASQLGVEPMQPPFPVGSVRALWRQADQRIPVHQTGRGEISRRPPEQPGTG